MNRLFYHLKFRTAQTFRICNQNPKKSIPIVFILIAIIFVKLPYEVLYPILPLALAFVFHISRKDIPFIQKVFSKKWPLIIFIELLIIYSLCLLSNINYKVDLYGLIAAIGLIPLICWNPKVNFDIGLQWNFIPDYFFEWKSFVRQYSWLFIVGYLILLCSAYHTLSLFLGAVFLTDYLSHIYEHNENKEMLITFFRKNSFNQKLRKNAVLFNILLLPVYIGYLIFNYAESGYILFYMLFVNLYFLLIVSRKYKLYDYKDKTNSFSIIVHLEYSFYSITVIPALIIIRQNFKQAQENISKYVGDQEHFSQL
ncbi:hypothetical protein VUJ46_01865 [Chryseobacterium sp. MYb264]|uniref:hypothetical protein n=1 Tax=Chryseobacterium sp. MYb264 TaxID=2745153 RepID=UPI002E102211|nr:hypothetical protein VUJ46_01865 [Chryseobacterium sp. MYb264]